MRHSHRAGRWPLHIVTAAVLALFASGLFSRCANVRGSLEGGLRDSLPPRVTGMTPRFNATGIRPERIRVTFDEFVQLKELRTEFFTSPLLTPTPEVRIKKKGIVVDIEAPLDSATTYVLNFGSSVVDNNESNPYHALKYTFSTGDHIDSMIMSGYAAGAFTGDTTKGAYILFYDGRDDLPGPDSLLFDLYRAKSVTKTMSGGGFIFANLRPIDYKIYALLDNNGNTMYDPGTDEVAFLDSLYNPTRMPSFLMWYDSTRMYPVAEPQIMLNTFVENPERQQNLSSGSRPGARQIVLRFSASAPVIDTFVLRGIDRQRVITEQTRPEGDSILYWIDLPPDEIPDTIVGRIVYHRPDSAGVVGPHGQDLRLVYNRPAPPPPPSRAEQREAERDEAPAARRPRRRDRSRTDEVVAPAADTTALAADSLAADSLATEPADTVPPSPMVFEFALAEPIVPADDLRLDFELPVIRFDTASVRLFRMADAPADGYSAPGAAASEGDAVGETEVPFTVSADEMHIRRFTFRADWADGVSYRLVIPAGAVETIDREVNDTIDHRFAVADREQLATLTLTPERLNPDYDYLVQLTDTTGRTILREAALPDSALTIHYLAAGPVRIRLIEDRDRNGRWDTGNVIRRLQPEQVRWYYDGAEKTQRLTLVERAEVQVSLDLTALFLPWSLESAYAAREAAEAEGAAETVEHGAESHEGHDHESHAGHDHATSPAFPATEVPAEAELATPGVEDFELLDRAADKKARREARRAARSERKEEERQRREQMRQDREAEKTADRI